MSLAVDKKIREDIESQEQREVVALKSAIHKIFGLYPDRYVKTRDYHEIKAYLGRYVFAYSKYGGYLMSLTACEKCGSSWGKRIDYPRDLKNYIEYASSKLCSSCNPPDYTSP